MPRPLTRPARAEDLLFHQPLRLSLSMCACFAAVLLCIVQRHVHVTLSDPNTYHSVTEHRCGWVFLITLTWALIETSLATTQLLLD